MYELLARLMLLAALAQLGMTLKDVRNCRSRACLAEFQARAYDSVLRINWKPIVVFKEEARAWKRQ